MIFAGIQPVLVSDTCTVACLLEHGILACIASWETTTLAQQSVALLSSYCVMREHLRAPRSAAVQPDCTCKYVMVLCIVHSEI